MSHPADSYYMFRGWPHVRAVDTAATPGLRFNGATPSVQYSAPNLSGRSSTSYDLANGEPKGETRGRDGDESDNTDKKEKTSFAQYLVSTSGFQGPEKIWEVPYRPLKVLWVLAFLAAFAMMVLQLNDLFTEFYSYPVKTQVRLKFSPLPLPAMTICNVNPVRKSYARYLSCQTQYLLRLDDADKSLECLGQTFPELDPQINGLPSFPGGSQETLMFYQLRRLFTASYLALENPQTLVTAGHQINDMILDCRLFQSACNFQNVTAFLSRDYGVCYTLSAPDIKAKKSGHEAALELTLNLETEDFLESYKTAYGLRVVLHEEGTRPFPSSQGFTVSQGTEADIAVRLTQIKRQGGSYGSCHYEDNLVKYTPGTYKYTIEDCQDQCVLRKVEEGCKCSLTGEGGQAEPQDPPLKMCATEKDNNCTARVLEEYFNETLLNGNNVPCDCPNPCQEMVYSTTLSTRSWPLLSHIKVLENEACTRNMLSPKCYYVGQDFSVDNIDMRKGFVRLRLYYERLNYEFVEESPFYNTERFLSDIGGTLGLWIGVTVLGVVEIVEIIFHIFSTCYKRLIRRRRSST